MVENYDRVGAPPQVCAVQWEKPSLSKDELQAVNSCGLTHFTQEQPTTYARNNIIKLPYMAVPLNEIDHFKNIPPALEKREEEAYIIILIMRLKLQIDSTSTV